MAKTILLRTYFELYLLDQTYYNLFLVQTQTFEKFIRRNTKISEIAKSNYLNFVLFTRKLGMSHYEHNISSDFRDKIKNAKLLPLKSWLLDKLDHAEKK